MVITICYLIMPQGWGLLKLYSLISLQAKFSVLRQHLRNINMIFNRSELHLLFESLPSFWIKPLKQGSPSRFDKAPQIGNVTLIQGTIFRFRSSLPIEGDFSKQNQNCISVSGLICCVDSVHCVYSDRIHSQITFHLIIFNSIILPVGKVTRETHWWITAQKLP